MIYKQQEKTASKEFLLSDYIIRVLPFTKIIFKWFPWLAQFINFSFVGIINMILSYAIYAFLIFLNFHPQIANFISFWLTVLNGYILNRFWVFKKQATPKSKAQTIKYFITYGFNLLLGIFLVYLYVDVLHLNKYIVPVISLPLTVPMNYLINRFWVFRKEN